MSCGAQREREKERDIDLEAQGAGFSVFGSNVFRVLWLWRTLGRTRLGQRRAEGVGAMKKFV